MTISTDILSAARGLAVFEPRPESIDALLGERERLVEAQTFIRARLGDIDDELLSHSACQGDGYVYNGTRYKRSGVATRIFDHDHVVRGLVSRALDDPNRVLNDETGEIEPPWVTVGRVIRDCLGTNPRWTVSGLERHGIHKDDPDYMNVKWEPKLKIEKVGDE